MNRRAGRTRDVTPTDHRSWTGCLEIAEGPMTSVTDADVLNRNRPPILLVVGVDDTSHPAAVMLGTTRPAPRPRTTRWC